MQSDSHSWEHFVAHTHTTHTHTLLESAVWNSAEGQTGSGDMGRLVFRKALRLPARFQSPPFL